MSEKQILAKKTYVDNSLDNVLRDVDGVVSIPNTQVELSQKIVTTTEEEVTTDEVVTESYLNKTKLHVEDSSASKVAEYGVNEIVLNGSTITGITDNANGSSSTLAVSQRALSNFKQVEANPIDAPTANLTTIKIDDTIYELDAGTNVSITPTITEGTKIADYSIDGVDGALYTTNTDESVELTTAEYNALPQSEKMNGTTYLLTDANVSSGGGGSSIDYSTTEQLTGRKWINSKPIYQKTLAFTNLTIPQQSRFTIPHGITNLDKMINLETQMTTEQSDYNGGVVVFPIYSAWCTSTDLSVAYYADWNGSNNRTWYFTIYYTKTTD